MGLVFNTNKLLVRKIITENTFPFNTKVRKTFLLKKICFGF